MTWTMGLLSILILVCVWLLIWVVKKGVEDIDERERLP